ncbi:hypothetical protein CEXT_590181 [Caerostris extrusa]|uniref:Uncharacterized protein n=1 Tax=Caerostris extrusa TaxID=172846 RepID=A0AAV4WMF8_CAEEX|nr:hypothetical protein CEXT_590181 [Caerostris extrusa]
MTCDILLFPKSSREVFIRFCFLAYPRKSFVLQGQLLWSDSLKIRVYFWLLDSASVALRQVNPALRCPCGSFGQLSGLLSYNLKQQRLQEMVEFPSISWDRTDVRESMKRDLPVTNSKQA